MKFSCRDPVSVASMKKIDEEWMIFDRFSDVDPRREIRPWKSIKFEKYLILMANNTKCYVIFQSSEYVVTSVWFNNISHPRGVPFSPPQIRGYEYERVPQRPQLT